MQYSFRKFTVSVVLSIKGREIKKRVKESGDCSENGICNYGLPVFCCSLLLLEALFMQISGVSLALTWPCRLCLLRFLLCVSLCYKLSPFQALGKVTLHPGSQACVFI
jgi:hypothetical protein